MCYLFSILGGKQTQTMYIFKIICMLLHTNRRRQEHHAPVSGGTRDGHNTEVFLIVLFLFSLIQILHFLENFIFFHYFLLLLFIIFIIFFYIEKCTLSLKTLGSLRFFIFLKNLVSKAAHVQK